MPQQSDPVRVPADVERPDAVIFGLTARQAVIVTLTALVAGGLVWLTLQLTPLPLGLAVGLAVPVVAVGVGLALGQRDGLSLDRWVWAALRHARSPRRLVAAPEGIQQPPAWLTTSATQQPDTKPPAPMHLPAQAVSPDGVIDLGTDGAALVCRATPVNLSLRTPEEQAALVGTFARFLHQVSGPVQVVMRAHPVDLTKVITQLTSDAVALPHPALETAANQHAEFLTDLAARRDVLARDLLLVVRDPAAGAAGHGGAGLLRRAEEAASLLAVAGVALTVLDDAHAAAALAAPTTLGAA